MGRLFDFWGEGSLKKQDVGMGQVDILTFSHVKSLNIYLNMDLKCSIEKSFKLPGEGS